MYRQIRSLPRAIHGKKAQCQKPGIIQVTVHVPHQFPAYLSAGVRTDGLQYVVILSSH